MTTATETPTSQNVDTYYKRLLQDSHSRIADDKAENFRPHTNTILVSPDPPETITKSGIHLPDTAIQQKMFGTVLAVPEGCAYQPGDRVLFRSQGGSRIQFPGIGECIILQYCGDIDDEILGKFARDEESC